jgi:hypothetical protein
MSKKHFIALADAIRSHNEYAVRDANTTPFTHEQMITLAEFCRDQNGRFNRERWLGYIAGTNGKNGGAIKKAA